MLPEKSHSFWAADREKFLIFFPSIVCGISSFLYESFNFSCWALSSWDWMQSGLEEQQPLLPDDLGLNN